MMENGRPLLLDDIILNVIKTGIPVIVLPVALLLSVLVLLIK